MKNLLDKAVECGIIDLDSVTFAMTKKEIQEKHPYKIYQGKDGRWKTYIFDKEYKNNRKLISKRTEKEVYDVLKKVYDTEAQVTLKSLYPEWLNYKKLHTTAETYIIRIDTDWKKYYLSSDFVNIPLKKINKINVDEFVHKLIKEYNMTKTCYYNVSMILRQELDYAVDIGEISENPLRSVKVDGRRLFRKVHKKPDETQVFSKNEFDKIINLALNDFISTKSKYPLAPLAIVFQMQTGVRIGEVCTVQYSDIEKDLYVHIQRMLRRDTGEVVDHTKGSYGDRMIPMTDLTKTILEKSKEKSGGVYIFSSTKKYLPEHAIARLYEKYCKQAGIIQKSSHKSRKTYISTLIDANVNINSIRKIVGHTDERTTLGNYCFDRKTETERIEAINAALKV